MTNPNTHYLQVPKELAKTRLDKFISMSIAEMSRSMVKRLVESNNVLKGDAVITDCSAYVKEGENFTVHIPPPSEPDMLPAYIPLEIVYEDAEFLVIDKQAGLTVHPGAGNHGDTMANALIAHCGDSLSGIGGVMRPGIVHRLDKDTTGLILAAKTDRAHHSLSHQIATRSLKRTYLAVCWGVPQPLEGRIDANIGRSPKNRKKMAVVGTGGKSACTNYSVVRVLGCSIAGLVECRLETGRTHQIRVHMGHIGHSLIGDQLYTGRRSGSIKTLSEEAQAFIPLFKRQALHSHKITLIHPVTGLQMEFASALPQDMIQLIEVLQGSTG